MRARPPPPPRASPQADVTSAPIEEDRAQAAALEAAVCSVEGSELLASALVWLKQGSAWAPRVFAVTGDAVWTVVEAGGAPASAQAAARRFRAVDSAPVSTLARVASQPDAPAVILEQSPGSTAIPGVAVWGSPTSEGTRTVEIEFGMPGEALREEEEEEAGGGRAAAGWPAEGGYA